ncbi:MAG: right-handed parallel beta-helix repeat-containing protein [Limisphaerales bacterium]
MFGDVYLEANSCAELSDPAPFEQAQVICTMYVMFNLFTPMTARIPLFFLIASGFFAFPGFSRSAVSRIDAGKYPDLQSAVDALPDTGGTVIVPAGEYVLSSPLRITSENVVVAGEGAGTVIKNANTNGQPAVLLAPKGFEKNRKLRLWRIQMTNLRITGTANSGHGILAQGIQEILLRNITVDHNGGHGVFLDHCYENPRVVNCMITYNALSGLHLVGCHDIVVNANQFEENLDALRCHDGFNLTMNGNNLDDHLRHGVVVENTYGSVLSGNMIEECNGTAVILDRDVYGVTVSANVIAHNMSGGVHCLDAHGCAISANTFTLVHSNSVYVARDSSRLTITGNNFCNSYTGHGTIRRKTDREVEKRPIQWDIGTGVKIEGASNIVISGNIFAGLDEAAIQASDDSVAILVNGNLVTDVNRHKPGGEPLELPRSAIRNGNVYNPKADDPKKNLNPL